MQLSDAHWTSLNSLSDLQASLGQEPTCCKIFQNSGPVSKKLTGTGLEGCDETGGLVVSPSDAKALS